jgi:hypothetical protein
VFTLAGPCSYLPQCASQIRREEKEKKQWKWRGEEEDGKVQE